MREIYPAQEYPSMDYKIPRELLKYPRLFSVYHSDAIDTLWGMDGYKMLAWTLYVRYLTYNREREILIHWIEGDIYYEQSPSREDINKELHKYPMGEVSLGEDYDSRFPEREVSDHV